MPLKRHLTAPSDGRRKIGEDVWFSWRGKLFARGNLQGANTSRNRYPSARLYHVATDQRHPCNMR
jgi:hypothetical protein